jgi:hypothetical protein
LNTNQNLTKERRTKIINKRLWIKVEISINERTTLKFRMVNVNFKGKREREKKKRLSATHYHINNDTHYLILKETPRRF